MTKMTTSKYNFVPNFVFDKVKHQKKTSKTKQYTKTLTWTYLAHWSWNHKDITVSLSGFGWTYRMKKSYAMYRKLINTFSHETLHGVIQKVMEQDKWSGSCTLEWPMKNGLDPDYARTMRKWDNND